MDSSEATAFLFLQSEGYSSVVLEPDGNSTPDFLVDGQIAVEVRRLNQNFLSPTGYEGLETIEASIYKRINALLDGYGPPICGRSWWVFYTIIRPMPKWRFIESRLRPFLDRILSDAPEHSERLTFSEGFRVDVSPAGIVLQNALSLGGYSDLQSGGFVLAKLIENMQISIAEKTAKILPAVPRYPKWWLILVERTGLGIQESDLNEIKPHLSIPNVWERVLVLDPKRPTRPLDLYP